MNLLSCERYKLLPFSGLALLLSNLLSACGGTSDPAAQQSSDEPLVTVDPYLNTTDDQLLTSYTAQQPFATEPIVTDDPSSDSTDAASLIVDPTPPQTKNTAVTSTHYLYAAEGYPGNDALREAWSGESWDGQKNNLAVILPGRVVVDSRDYQDFNLFPIAFYNADSNIYLTGVADEPIENPSYFGSEFYPARLLKLDTNFEPVSEFGDNGIISAPFPTAEIFTDGSNQDSDYIYAWGYDETSATIARIDKKTGASDSDFAEYGVFEFGLDAFPADIKAESFDSIGVTALENNKLLITYWLYSDVIMIQKLEADGSVDKNFGENGFLLLRNVNEQTLFFDYFNQNNLIYDPDNETFLLVGYDYNELESLYINRYDINGQLDMTFANQGYYEIHKSKVPAEVSFGGGEDSFYYDDDEDAIYITHLTYYDSNDNQNYAIIKLSYNTDKTQLSLDEDFGTQGILVSSVSSNAYYADTEKVDDQLFLFGGDATILDDGYTTTDHTIEHMTFNINGNELEINSVNTAFPVTNFIQDTVFNAVDNDQFLLVSSLSSYQDGTGVLLSLTGTQLQNQHLAVMHENTQETLLVGLADFLDSGYWFEPNPDFYYLSDDLAPDGTITLALSCNAPGIRFSYTGDEEIGFTSLQNDGIANASFELTRENYNQFHRIEMIAAEVNEDTYVEVTVTSTYTDSFIWGHEHEVSEERTFLLTILDSDSSDSDAFLG